LYFFFFFDWLRLCQYTINFIDNQTNIPLVQQGTRRLDD